jgi:hypothetical protein
MPTEAPPVPLISEQNLETVTSAHFVEYLKIHLEQLILAPIEQVLMVNHLTVPAMAHLELVDEKVRKLECLQALEPGKGCDFLFCFDAVMTTANAFNIVVQFHRICSRHNLRIDQINVENIVYKGSKIQNTLKNQALIHFQPI